MTETEFRDSFRRYQDVVYRFAYRMTGSGSTAEDVTQECFVALWKKPDAYDPARGAMRSYLLGMARNQVLKQWRHESRYQPEEAEPIVAPVDLVGLERSAAVAAAVRALPALQREAVVLAEYEDLSLDEIAIVTGADLAAIKSRLHRARQNLRKILAPLLDPPLLEKKGCLHGTPK
jgi:RNA polymerase sigma factor (sigma-70 family)